MTNRFALNVYCYLLSSESSLWKDVDIKTTIIIITPTTQTPMMYFFSGMIHAEKEAYLDQYRSCIFRRFYTGYKYSLQDLHNLYQTHILHTYKIIYIYTRYLNRTWFISGPKIQAILKSYFQVLSMYVSQLLEKRKEKKHLSKSWKS